MSYEEIEGRHCIVMKIPLGSCCDEIIAYAEQLESFDERQGPDGIYRGLFLALYFRELADAIMFKLRWA